MEHITREEAYDLLKKYEVKKIYNNVKFTGYYPKKEEFSIVDGCDFMNIILPDDTLSRYLISNRFYLSLLRRKPMIVSSGGIQAEYVKEYDDVVNISRMFLSDYFKGINSFDYLEEINTINVEYLNQVLKDVFNEKNMI